MSLAVALISKKKQVYRVGDKLRAYLGKYGRLVKLPAHFGVLNRFTETISLRNKQGKDTLWETVIYPRSEWEEINRALVSTYASLKVLGNMTLMEHLVTDRVDTCTWGNTKPIRVRILNTLNENFDYFYVKKADASRVYGLELEHLLSPNRIEFLVDGDTIIEEHIPGIPGDEFIGEWLNKKHLDEIRLAKEFVKFNERCFVRLLGDMHPGNWVVDVTPDFDETHYRIRAIDFDQQSYERRLRVYSPQYYKRNNGIVFLGMKCMTEKTFAQYRQEELTLIATRARAERPRLNALLEAMSEDAIAPQPHVDRLRGELAQHYDDHTFHFCESMGELVRASLEQLPVL